MKMRTALLAAFAVGLIGSLVIFARGLLRKQLPSERVSQGDVVQE
jgi:hypothetical protein